MNRFFIDKKQIDNNNIKIIGKDVKHIKDVLRLKPKDIIEAISEGRCYICEIAEIESNVVKTSIVESFKGKNEPPIDITLYQGLAKANKMDFVIQKCTELGVKEIYPVITSRTIVKIQNKKKGKNKVSRWNTIAEQASKQSKRDAVLSVNDIINYKQMIYNLEEEKNIIVPYEMEDSCGLKEVLKNMTGEKINIIIGPEGGFEEEEIQILEDIGGQVVTLGPRIFRTETAGIVASSIVLYELGDLGVVI